MLNALGPLVRRVAAPAAGVLALTALPLRMLQIQFIELLTRLGDDAPYYGNLLTAVSMLVLAAYVVSLYGRAVYMQACRTPAGRWRDLFRIDLRAFVSYVYVSLLLYLMLIIFAVTVFPVPFIVLLGGLAAAVLTDAHSGGVLVSLRALSPYLGAGSVLAALLFVFICALFVAIINLAFLGSLVLWLFSSFPGVDGPMWEVIMSGSKRYTLVLLAMGVTIVEPFWLGAMHLYAERVRARGSGDDLRRRFVALTRPAVAGVVVLLTAGALRAEPITMEAYLQRLDAAAESLSAGKPAEAATHLQPLRQATEIRSGPIAFGPDLSLVVAAEQAAAAASPDPALLRRLRLTAAELRSAPGPSEDSSADAALLQRIRERERAGELWHGGEVISLPQADPTLFSELARMWRGMMAWLAEKLERLFDLIRSLFRSRREKPEEGEFLGVSFIVWGVTLLVVAVVISLALFVIRRSRRQQPRLSGEPVADSLRDEDPLSREAGEWERYAAELAAAGHYRESFRAWYHAVLMTLFRAGILRYRKGLTNWEYVAAVPPEAQWRPSFAVMTREFDREWYGRTASAPELLDRYRVHAESVLAAVEGEQQ